MICSNYFCENEITNETSHNGMNQRRRKNDYER